MSRDAVFEAIDNDAQVTVWIDGQTHTITAGRATTSGPGPGLFGFNGIVKVISADGNTAEIHDGSVVLAGTGARITLNTKGLLLQISGNTGIFNTGSISLSDGSQRVNLDAHTLKLLLGEGLSLDGKTGRISAGGHGQYGDLQLFADGAETASTIHLDGKNGNIRLDGDIRLAGADCAEDFDLAEAVDSGTVMIIDEEGALRQCREAYDSRVAGLVAGAGEYRTGIILDSRPSGNRMPLALIGKAFCKVDAQYAAIGAGDLLTTSPTPGRAMKATDPSKALGTLIGKALRPLAAGCGLIPILVGTR